MSNIEYNFTVEIFPENVTQKHRDCNNLKVE